MISRLILLACVAAASTGCSVTHYSSGNGEVRIEEVARSTPGGADTTATAPAPGGQPAAGGAAPSSSRDASWPAFDWLAWVVGLIAALLGYAARDVVVA